MCIGDLMCFTEWALNDDGHREKKERTAKITTNEANKITKVCLFPNISFLFIICIPHLFPSRLCIVKHGTTNQGGCVGRCNEIYKQSNCRMCLYLGRGPSMNTLQNTWPRFSLDLQKIVFFFRSVTTLTPCIHL